MATWYDVTVAAPIPHGSDILNKPCTVTFTYPGGSSSQAYNGTIEAWRTPTVVAMSSAYLNIQDAWTGANGGTLNINNGAVVAAVVGFVKT